MKKSVRTTEETSADLLMNLSKEELFSLIKAIAKNIAASETEEVSTADDLLKSGIGLEILTDLDADAESPSECTNSNLTRDVKSVDYWIDLFERNMMIDPNAANSITGYYLEAAIGKPCSIFCPLGWEPYESMGKKLAESALIRDAAKASGLFADGISGFMNAALDNADCWWGMCDGVEYLINNPELRHFVCFHDRYIAERLLRFNDTFKEDLDAWYGIVRNLKKDFGDELRGY